MNKRCQLIEHHHLHDGAIHWISLKVVLILLGLLCSLLRTASSEAHSHVEASHAEHAGTVEVMDHGNTTEHAVPAALQTEASPHPAPKPETLGNLASQPQRERGQSCEFGQCEHGVSPKLNGCCNPWQWLHF